MVGAKLVKIDKFCPLMHVSLGFFATTAIILHSIIISFVAAWLARDTALASSVHSLQEMTDADEGRKTPFGVIRGNFPSFIS